MTLVVDAGPLYTHADRADPDFAKVVELFKVEPGPFIVSAFVAAEADYMILDRLGVDAELAFFLDLAAGRYQLEHLTAREMTSAREYAGRYRDHRLGTADTSNVLLAARFRTTRIATFDERHYRAITPLQGGFFTLVPED